MQNYKIGSLYRSARAFHEPRGRPRRGRSATQYWRSAIDAVIQSRRTSAKGNEGWMGTVRLNELKSQYDQLHMLAMLNIGDVPEEATTEERANIYLAARSQLSTEDVAQIKRIEYDTPIHFLAKWRVENGTRMSLLQSNAADDIMRRQGRKGSPTLEKGAHEHTYHALEAEAARVLTDSAVDGEDDENDEVLSGGSTSHHFTPY